MPGPLLVLIFIIGLGFLGVWAYRALKMIANRGCITVIKGTTGYSCKCEGRVSSSDCSARKGVYQSTSCSNPDAVQAICQNQLLGSCITSTGCAWPIMQSECEAAKGAWTVGKKCSSVSAGASQAGTAWT